MLLFSAKSFCSQTQSRPKAAYFLFKVQDKHAVKNLYFLLHQKPYFCTVQAWDMTLKSFYDDSILKSHPSIESKRGSQRWVLEEMWAVLGGGVVGEAEPRCDHKPRCSIAPSAGLLWQSTAVTHSEQVPQWHSTMASRLSGAWECTLCLAVKME